MTYNSFKYEQKHTKLDYSELVMNQDLVFD